MISQSRKSLMQVWNRNCWLSTLSQRRGLQSKSFAQLWNWNREPERPKRWKSTGPSIHSKELHRMRNPEDCINSIGEFRKGLSCACIRKWPKSRKELPTRIRGNSIQSTQEREQTGPSARMENLWFKGAGYSNWKDLVLVAGKKGLVPEWPRFRFYLINLRNMI